MSTTDEVTVSSTQGLSRYITQVANLLENKGEATITAINLAIPQAINLVELIKHRVKGLHQINTFERVQDSNKTRVTLHLSFKQLDSRDKGYQAPISESEVTVKTFDELRTAPVRER